MKITLSDEAIEKMFSKRSFNILLKNNAVYGMMNSDSLEEAKKELQEFCLEKGLNYDDYHIEEQEVSKLMHEKKND